MSYVKQIICLSNSNKLGERCIAGIEVVTGKWIRPVCDTLYPEDGRVPRDVGLIEGREPELLDIIEIQLASSGNNFGIECENFSILPSQWKLIRKANPSEVVQYCRNNIDILHNRLKYVEPSYLKKLPLDQRNSLQLVETANMTVVEEDSKWKGSFQTSNGQIKNASITDLVFLEKLKSGYRPNGPLLVTVSLSMPHEPDIVNWDKGPVCWKLIAGVIEIPSVDVQQSLDLGF